MNEFYGKDDAEKREKRFFCLFCRGKQIGFDWASDISLELLRAEGC